MEAAEFIIDGDATKAVAAMHQFDAAAKQLEKTLKKIASENKNDSATHIASVRNIASEYLAMKMNADQARAAVRQLLEIQKKGPQSSFQLLPEGVLPSEKMLNQHFKWIEESAQEQAARHAFLANSKAAREKIAADKVADAWIQSTHQILMAEESRHAREGTLVSQSASRAAASAAADAAVNARRQRDLQQIGGGFMTAADKAMRFNMVMGQMGYAASDFFSVTGGLEVRLRAIANNVQMMAMLIPGPWGLAINVMTIATQAAVSLGASFFDSGKKIDEHKDKVLTIAEYYQKLSTELDKATHSQEEFDLAQQRREMDKTLAPERKKLKELEESSEAEARAIEWAKRNNLDPTTYIAEHKRLVAEKVKTKGEIDKVEAEFAELGKASQRKVTQRKAEDFIKPAEDDLAKIYGREAANMGRGQALARLAGNISGELPQGLRGEGVAEMLAKRIAEKSETDLSGQRLKQRFDGTTPEEAALNQKKEEIRRAKIAREEQELAADADGRRSRQEKKGLDATDRFIKGLEIAAMKLEAAFDTRKEADRVGLINGPRVPVPAPINRNAGL